MTDDAAVPHLEVVRDDDRSRYVLRVDGVEAGFSAFRLRPDQVIFTHTVVQPEFEGRGLGSVLAKAALDDVVERGLKIVPECPFIRTYVGRHHEYDDSVIPPWF